MVRSVLPPILIVGKGPPTPKQLRLLEVSMCIRDRAVKVMSGGEGSGYVSKLVDDRSVVMGMIFVFIIKR